MYPLMLSLALAQPPAGGADAVDLNTLQIKVVHTLYSVVDKRGYLPAMDPIPDRRCVLMSVRNNGARPVRLATLRIVWTDNTGKELEATVVEGPNAPLLPGREALHYFQVVRDGKSRWRPTTSFSVVPARAVPVELTPAEIKEAQADAARLTHLEGIQGDAIYQFGVHWGDRFTLINTNRTSCAEVLVMLVGTDPKGRAVRMTLFKSGNVRPGNTAVMMAPDEKNDWRMIHLDYVNGDLSVRAARHVIYILGAAAGDD